MKFKSKSLLSIIATLGLLSAGLSMPAQAAGGPAIDLVDTSDTLAGSTISGYPSGTTLRLGIISNMGTVTWNNNGSGANLVSNAGNTSQGVWLEGTQDQLNAALSEIAVNKPCAGSYKIYAQVSDSGYLQDPVSHHLYKMANNYTDIGSAIANAAATPLVVNGTDTFGYLATVTNSIENIIVSQFFGYGWLGASDSATEGDWKWITGPEAGTSFYSGRGDQGGSVVGNSFAGWNSGEPNDWGGGEDDAEILGDGTWNDINGGSHDYAIEWGGMPGDDLSSVSVVSDSVDISVVGAFTGSGTQADPYLIPDATALHSVSGCGGRDIYFKQTANITLPSSWAGDQNFQGHYDGDNKKISFSPGTIVNHYTFGVWQNASDSGSSFVNMDVAGDLSANGYGTVGLLYGNGYATVSDSKFSGSIEGATGGWNYGAVAGESGGNFNNVTSTVNLTGTDVAGSVGGIVGYYWGTMNHSKWEGTITLSGPAYSVGGLVGDTDCATINRSHSAGTIAITGGGQSIGGIAGYFCGETVDSYSTVDITAPDANNVGGVAGRADGNFFRVAAFGDISGNDAVGGLFGWASYNTAEDVFARGNVTAQMSGGSLVGSIENFSLYRAYATGTVTAPTSRGALGQYNNSEMDALHWIPEQSTVTVPDPLQPGEAPYTLVDAKNIDFYSVENWDIGNDWQNAHDDGVTWTICQGFNDGYPILTSLYASDPCAPELTNATAPTITGSGVVGKPLAMNKGAWDAGVTFTYQWKLDGNNVSGATGATYTPVSGDVGKTVTVELTGAKQGFKTAVKLSSNSVLVSAAPVVVIPTNTEVAIGEFAGNSWWIPVGFLAKVKAAVKAHGKATLVTCVGLVTSGGNKAWQKTLGLKRAALACSTVRMYNSKLKTKLEWRVSTSSDAVKRGAALKFNK